MIRAHYFVKFKSVQKHICEKEAKFGTNGFADKRAVIPHLWGV